MFINTYIFIYTHTYICISILYDICEYIYKYKYICLYIHIYNNICIYINVYTYVCKRQYINIHIYTCTYMNAPGAGLVGLHLVALLLPNRANNQTIRQLVHLKTKE